jgi:hypothetical protein
MERRRRRGVPAAHPQAHCPAFLPQRPRLLDTQTVGDGIAILTYETVRDAERAADDASLQDKRAAALRRAGIRESA